MALTQSTIINAVASNKPLKLSDSGGLFLLVQPDGSKQWRFRYRFSGRENMLALGSFPTLSLVAAREKRDALRQEIVDGVDPAIKRKLERAVAATAANTTFGLVAAEFLEHVKANGAAERTLFKYRWMLQELASPIAQRPIANIMPAEVLMVLKRVEKSGRRESARRLRSVMGAVFRHAIVTLRATNDPTYALRGALLKPIVQHRAAITDEKEVGRLLLAIEEYEGWPTIRAGLLLLALTMVRPGDVRGMRRSEINFERAMWRIPAERMKMRRPHDVPLSTQALAILKEIWSLSDNGDLVLPSIRTIRRPLSDNAMNVALRRMGYAQNEMVAHGFRATASTILNERGFNPDVIEAALAHQDNDVIRRVYNRATYWPERVKMMQAWSDLLDEFKKGSVGNRRVA